METRKSRRKLSELESTNAIAHRIVAQTTGEKNPHAVALAKLGASKGGMARAKVLSAKKRKEIAKLAAATRWKK